MGSALVAIRALRRRPSSKHRRHTSHSVVKMPDQGGNRLWRHTEASELVLQKSAIEGRVGELRLQISLTFFVRLHIVSRD